MPKKNPKHNQKRAVEARNIKYSNNSVNWMGISMVAIAVVAIVGTIAIFTYGNDAGWFDPEPEPEPEKVIEDGDTAEIEYKLWADNDHDGEIDFAHTEPDQHQTFTTSVTKDSLINGFYNNLLGKKIGDWDRFQLEANVDADGDDIDDYTGEPVVSYGTPGHELFNTSLVFWFRIHNITKAEPSSAGAAQVGISTTELEDFESQITVQSIFLNLY